MNAVASPVSADDRLALVLADLGERQRLGQAADIEQSANDNPDIADELRALWATAQFAAAFAATPTVLPATSGFDPSAAAPAPPEAVGDYEILAELGRGGMGVVYKARQRSLNRLVAVKLMREARLSSDTDRARFMAEAEAAAKLKHPNIVTVFEVGHQDGLPYIVMEYVAGRTLSQQLAEGPLPPRVAARLLADVARGVHHAHEWNVLHRDLKPANILYSAAGAPKVADFGLARRTDGPGLTVTGEVMGTPAYMAPEQAGGKRVTGAADVYSLGAVVYECLTGRPPFTGANAAEILMRVLKDEPPAAASLAPGVPGDLAIICHQCLRKDPARRYGSAAALEADLRAFLDGRTASPACTPPRPAS